MSRAQANIVSITLIVILSISLAGTAYLWLWPLIQKRQDTIKAENLLSDFDSSKLDSLPGRIEHVAKTRAEITFTIRADGIWILSPEENYIQFSTFSKVSNIAVGKGWIPHTPGGQCPTPLAGRIGEPASVVCINSTAQAGGFVLTYRAVFRDVTEDAKIYRIKLENATSKLRSSEGTIRLLFGGIEQPTSDLIITKVLILFL